MLSNDDFILWEQGGAGTGAFVGFKDGYLRIRAGAGGSSISVPGTSTSNMAVLDVPYSDLSCRWISPVASCMIFDGK